MLICHTCNQKNDDGCPACVNCGARLDVIGGKATYIDTGGSSSPRSYAPPHSSPNPPSWQTTPSAQPLAGFHKCPFCQSQLQTIIRNRISTGGWITFAILLTTCLPLFWIGLLMTESYTVCAICRKEIR